jgi:hypothetical protein
MRQVHTGTQWRSLAEATIESALALTKKETFFNNDETAFFDLSLDGEEDSACPPLVTLQTDSFANSQRLISADSIHPVQVPVPQAQRRNEKLFQSDGLFQVAL